ncbi:unnamed protein product [Laminaria digitata]
MIPSAQTRNVHEHPRKVYVPLSQHTTEALSITFLKRTTTTRARFAVGIGTRKSAYFRAQLV